MGTICLTICSSLPREEALGLPKEQVGTPRGAAPEQAQRPSADTGHVLLSHQELPGGMARGESSACLFTAILVRANTRLGPHLNSPRGFIKLLSFTRAIIILYRGAFTMWDLAGLTYLSDFPAHKNEITSA